MLIPAYWAEASERVLNRHRHWVTMRRFGWSEVGAAEAQAHAEERLREAVALQQAGTNLPAREPAGPYDGAEGVPIREEVLARQGEAVLTRNSYGAPCLNTPNVLFADIDCFAPSPQAGWLHWLVMVVLAFWVVRALAAGNWMMAGGSALAIVGVWVAVAWRRTAQRRRVVQVMAQQEPMALERIRRFVQAQAGWGCRVYRTPAGLRVLVTHRAFDPGEAEVQACFEAWQVDPLYRRLCERQRCFRARVGAKPWRAGVIGRLPAGGRWPVGEADRAARDEWVARYERHAQGYAACRFLEAVGAPAVHPAVQPLVDWHDQLSGALRELPLA